MTFCSDAPQVRVASCYRFAHALRESVGARTSPKPLFNAKARCDDDCTWPVSVGRLKFRPRSRPLKESNLSSVKSGGTESV